LPTCKMQIAKCKLKRMRLLGLAVERARGQDCRRRGGCRRCNEGALKAQLEGEK
jgi:hypothetical protein